mmetsp:Transcript_21793/g.72193  ORF Transcript_21793/g.72193 Transcript_21793/m.72193 type:complete len:237 (+) Transcript_21793:43-753(+)
MVHVPRRYRVLYDGASGRAVQASLNVSHGHALLLVSHQLAQRQDSRQRSSGTALLARGRLESLPAAPELVAAGARLALGAVEAGGRLVPEEESIRVRVPEVLVLNLHAVAASRGQPRLRRSRERRGDSPPLHVGPHRHQPPVAAPPRGPASAECRGAAADHLRSSVTLGERQVQHPVCSRAGVARSEAAEDAALALAAIPVRLIDQRDDRGGAVRVSGGANHYVHLLGCGCCQARR